MQNSYDVIKAINCAIVTYSYVNSKKIFIDWLKIGIVPLRYTINSLFNLHKL